MDKKSISSIVMCITNENEINSLGPILAFLSGGTVTLVRHPNTHKYLLDDCLLLHNSYRVFSAFFLGTLFKS